jgi:hypothetical protein
VGWACGGVGRGLRGWREVSEMAGPTWVHAGSHDDSVSVPVYVGLGEVCGWSKDMGLCECECVCVGGGVCMCVVFACVCDWCVSA